MMKCYHCKKEVNDHQPRAIFYSWTFHLACFVQYVETHLRKEHDNEEAETIVGS